MPILGLVQTYILLNCSIFLIYITGTERAKPNPILHYFFVMMQVTAFCSIFIGFFIIFSSVKESDAAVSTQEKAEWVKFYNALNGNSWSTSWNINDDPCDGNWFHVTCDDADVRVLEVDLENNNVSGTLPDLDLPDLQLLYALI